MIELKITSENVEVLKDELKGLINAIEVGKDLDTPSKLKDVSPKVVDKKEVEVNEEAEVDKKDEQKGISLEEVRAKAKELASKKDKSVVKKLLTEFKASKLPELPESKYADFIQAVEDLLND